MAITEESRHRMYQRLEEVLGREQAATLMEHLPPVGWADVATKRDLDVLRSELVLHFDATLQRELRAQTFRFLTAFTALAGVMVAAIRL